MLPAPTIFHAEISQQIECDREWFEAHPGLRFREREILPVEIKVLQAVGHEPIPKMVIVKRISKKIHLKTFESGEPQPL